MSPERWEGVFGVLGGRVIERDWLCAIGKANGRTDNGLGADAKLKHEAPPIAYLRVECVNLSGRGPKPIGVNLRN